VKIRAEDGRSITGVDISPFINNLRAVHDTVLHSECQWQYFPSGKHQRHWAGARLLLVDEDTAATNFMIRDRRMQLLIAKKIRADYTVY